MHNIYSVTLANRRKVAENTYEITFDFSKENFTFRSGQYIWVTLPEMLFPDVRGDVRAFSIASSPDAPERVSILTRASESGYKKTLLAIPLGSEIKVSGPFGFLSLPEKNTRPVVLIAGGVGVAPFLSMLRDAVTRKSDQLIILLFSNSSEEWTPYRDELERLQRENPHITILFKVGEIDNKFIQEATKELQWPLWYVMGPEAMVNHMGMILSNMGVPDGDVHYEEYSPFFYREKGVFSENSFLEKGALRTGIESSASQIILTDPDGKIFYANPAAEKITGYAISEMLGQTPRLWGGLMNHAFYENLWSTIRRDHRTFNGQVTNRRKNGEQYVAVVHISPFFSKDGKLAGFVGTEEDVTELFRAKEDAMRLARIVESSVDAIISCDPNDNIISWNPAAERLFEYKAEEMVGKSIFMIAGDKKEEMIANRDRVRGGAIIQDARSERKRKDGAVMTLLGSLWPIYDANNNFIGISILYHDISRDEALRHLESQFIATASHQLRTPLTGIQWVVERFLKTEKPSERARGYLQDIHDSVMRLGALINTFLNVSRIEGGKISIIPISIDAVSFVGDYLKECEPLFAQKNQTLTFEKNQESIKMTTDQDAFRNIIQSLVSNAIEYTPDEGNIKVTLEEQGDNLMFAVSDTGIGIPDVARDFIFAKFFRAENAKLFKADGTGLGLYIASEDVKLLGGTITFVSEVDHGTTFTIIIPLITKPVASDVKYPLEGPIDG
jgi:PAS domain S-box-containing protein